MLIHLTNYQESAMIFSESSKKTVQYSDNDKEDTL